MAATTEKLFCEVCGRQIVGPGISLPQSEVEAAKLDEEVLTEDPSCLRFCTETCKQKWGTMRQRAKWESHGDCCLCPMCM